MAVWRACAFGGRVTEAAFLTCCGSRAWARRMAESHDPPAYAEEIWWSLSPADWLEAFRAHPRIGEQLVSARSRAERWADREQSGAAKADMDLQKEMREANRLYDEKFGHIFIVCASGKSMQEMVAMLCARLADDSKTDLGIAANEQAQITRLRLAKIGLQ